MVAFLELVPSYNEIKSLKLGLKQEGLGRVNHGETWTGAVSASGV